MKGSAHPKMNEVVSLSVLLSEEKATRLFTQIALLIGFADGHLLHCLDHAGILAIGLRIGHLKGFQHEQLLSPLFRFLGESQCAGMGDGLARKNQGRE